MRRALLIVVLVLAVMPAGGALAQAGCAYRLFVSGYFSGVHVYDACTGAYLRDLDPLPRIRGAQAVRLGPDGLLYVVSELSQQILRYRNDTLAFVDMFAGLPPGSNPTAVAFAPNGDVYVSGFETDEVRRYSAAGVYLDSPVPARTAGLNGPDNGMTFAPDGNLYIPSFNNSALYRHDPRTGDTTRVTPAGTPGLVRTRGILPERGTSALLITAEGSGTLLRYDPATGTTGVVRSGLATPTGIDYAPNGDLLIASTDRVVRLDPATGADRGTLVTVGSGGLDGSVFLAVVPIAGSVPAQVSVVEFHHAGLDHYFISSLAADIQAIDSGALRGWVRTGRAFNAWSGTAAGTNPVCRFYLPPANGDSHFYSASPAECEAVRTRFPTFVHEAADVFHIALPDVSSGACPVGTVVVYRLWNGRTDSNHRYTTSAAIKAEMLARGYVAEGYGPDGAIMCAAP